MALSVSATPALPFGHSVAVVIGIEDYGHGIPRLATPVNDATVLADRLKTNHGYEVMLLTENVTRACLEELFTRNLPARLGRDDRLLFYFAGHGIALDGDDGPAGYLVPQDADLADSSTFLRMPDVQGWLDGLTCRHLLAILDCCFAGAFRWASKRDLKPLPPTLYRERYDRFVRSPAWQVLTSAAYDQTALDALAGDQRRGSIDNHSPFAAALIDALSGAADVSPAGGNGVITATELYMYLRETVEVRADERAGHPQTPMLWPLSRHGNGEYVFLTPGRQPDLAPAPPLTLDKNPYRGLKAYEFKKADWELFFGREDDIRELAALVEAQTVVKVVGASGSGKSSLVKAGLLPYLQDPGHATAGRAAWTILPPFRASAMPVAAFAAALDGLAGAAAPDQPPATFVAPSEPEHLYQQVAAWLDTSPEARLVIVVDQFEELVTLCRSDAERDTFLALLTRLAGTYPERLRVIVTLRDDFAQHFVGAPLIAGAARFPVRSLNGSALRSVIEGPAGLRELYFDPPELVDELIDRVEDMPGTLPLLSFSLDELYVRYLRRQEAGQARGEILDRSLTGADYRALGGVEGALQNAAESVYDNLPDDDHRATMQRVMLRMISVEGGELARRRVSSSELDYGEPMENGRVAIVLDRLVDARLLVRGGADRTAGSEGGRGRDSGEETYVEPAHDALVLGWDRMLTWKRAADEYLPLQQRLAAAATEWRAAAPRNRPGLLWNDNPRLPQLERLVAARRSGFLPRLRQSLFPDAPAGGHTGWLNGRELAFVQASRLKRARLLRRTIGLTAGAMIGLAVLAVVALIQADVARKNEARAVDASNQRATEVAVRTTAQANEAAARQVAQTREAEAQEARQVALTREAEAQAAATAEAQARDTAEQQRAAAEASARKARAGDLAAQSLGLVDQNPELALLLAREAVQVTWKADGLVVPRARAALQRGLASAFRGVLLTATDPPASVAGDVLASGDGRHIVVLDYSGSSGALFDVDGRLIAEFKGSSAVFSPDGGLLAVLEDKDGPVSVYATSSGTARTWKPAGLSSLALSFTEGNQILVSGCVSADCTSRRYTLIDPASGRQTALTTPVRRLARTNADYSVQVDKDGAYLVDPKGNRVAALEDVTGELQDVQVSGDGGRVAAAMNDNRIALWNREGKRIATLSGNLLSLHPSGTRLVTAAEYGATEVSAWDGDGHRLATVIPHAGRTMAVVYTGDPPYFITSGCDARPTFGEICEAPSTRMWSVDDGIVASVTPTGEPAQYIHAGADFFVTEECPAESEALAGDPPCMPKRARYGVLWDATTGMPAPAAELGAIPAGAQLSPDGRSWLTTGCPPGSPGACTQLQIDSFEERGRPRTIARIPVESANAAYLSADGSRVLLQGVTPDPRPEAGGAVLAPPLMLFDRGTGRWAAAGDLAENYGWAALTPDGQRMVAVRDDNSGFVWDADGKRLSEVRLTDSTGNFEYPTGALSPDGRHAVLVGCTMGHMGRCDDDNAIVWDLESGALRVLSVGTGYLASPAFSKDGAHVVLVNGTDNVVQVWDVRNLSQRATISGVQAPHLARFNSAGDLLMIAEGGGRLSLWDLDGNSLGAVTAFGSEVRAAEWLGASGAVVAAGCDNRVPDSYTCSKERIKVIRFLTGTEEMLAAAGERLGRRQLTADECQAYLGAEACPGGSK